MSKITLNVSDLSENEQNEFIDGFRSVLAIDELDNERPYCAPWTYTDSIDVESDSVIEQGNVFAIGREYAFEVREDVLKDICLDVENEISFFIDTDFNFSSINDFSSRFLEVSNHRGTSFKLTPYGEQFIEVFYPDLKINYIGLINGEICCIDEDGFVVAGELNEAVQQYLDTLCELAKVWRDCLIREE